MFKIRKEVVLISVFIFSLLLVSIIPADERVDKAYTCLENKVTARTCSALSFDEKVFSLLSLSYKIDFKTSCRTAILSQKSSPTTTEDCWPSSGCTLRETALAAIALNSIGENTTKAVNWLQNKNKFATGIDWFLEIDTTAAGSCTILYQDTRHTITIDAEKRLSGTLGECLTFANNNNWMKITPTCLDENFKVQCDKYFISTLLYKKANSDIWHISSNSQSQSEGGVTEHNVSFYCFGTDSCDYEGSLWAAYALKTLGKNIDRYIPYLVSFADDATNQQWFPSAFLYSLTNSEEYLSIMNSKYDQLTKSWIIGERGAGYSTALAILALRGSGSASDAKQKVLDNADSSGCISGGDIRNSAFLLWAGWSKAPAVPCEIIPGFCLSFFQFNLTQGTELGGSCSQSKICSDTPPLIDRDCEDVGVVCVAGERCDGTTQATKDQSKCCLGSCISSNCSELEGQLCETGLSCDGDSVVSADTERCCIGSCVDKTCVELGGSLCSNNESCSVDYTTTKDTENCCPSQGSCDFTTRAECENDGFYCTTQGECDSAFGDVIQNEFCPGSYKCCSEPPLQELTCDEKNGESCPYGKMCSEGTVSSADEYECCLATCIEDTTPDLTECEQEGYSCFSSCSPDEESKNYGCNTGQICCGDANNNNDDEQADYTWLIVLLVILILLVLLAIVFRNKLRIMLHRFFPSKKGPSSMPGRPPFMPPTTSIQRPMQRPTFMPPRQIPTMRQVPSRPPVVKPSSKDDKEMEETFKKLKELSKEK